MHFWDMIKIRLHCKEYQEKRSTLFAWQVLNYNEQEEDSKNTKFLCSRVFLNATGRISYDQL